MLQLELEISGSKVHRKEQMQMKTIMFYELIKSERDEKALEREQGLHFAYTFLIRRKQDCCDNLRKL